MPRVDFFISSDRHHVAAALPVMERLADRGYGLRVVSLCELRGLVTPAERFEPLGAEVLRAVPWNVRSSPASGGQQGGTAAGSFAAALRRTARSLAWSVVLGPRLRRFLDADADLAVLPNDSAYPYDRIAALLRRRQIPFLLLPEGIRFPLAGAPDRFGLGGASAIAAWGESSADYFRAQGVDPARIHLTGSPRFDVIDSRDWQPEANRLRDEHGLGETNLLLVSNPIDDQGFVSTAEKLRLVRRFAEALRPLLDQPGFRLVVKLHSRESARDFAAALADAPGGDRIRLLTDAPLYPLLAAVDATVILASTVGLEALCFSSPLGVLQIPGTGFVYDYVHSGAAMGLSWDRPMDEQIRTLLASGPVTAAARFLNHNISMRSGSAVAVADLIGHLLEGTPGESQ